jgi:hypothetical protein
MNERLRGFEGRLQGVEDQQAKSHGDHEALKLADKALEVADSQTASAVAELTKAINHPETGLVVDSTAIAPVMYPRSGRSCSRRHRGSRSSSAHREE